MNTRFPGAGYHHLIPLSSTEALSQTRRKAREKKKSGTFTTKCAVLGSKVAVLGMCNNNNGSDSESRISTSMHMVGFIMEPGGRAEPGVANDSDKSLTALEL